tara:strand:+ start:3876 stop:4655 length:780 start_codon:yes stop_codon:yes gene_type:complete
MFDFEIAIPSFNREDILPKKTLKMLYDLGVNSNKIRIFLKDEEQLEKYKKSCGENYNYELTGQSGIMATRNYLQVYYHEINTKSDGVLFIDDDITKITEKDRVFLSKPFMELVEYFFIETKKRGGRLWSINALNNEFFMKDNISTNLKYCIGAFKGVILDRTRDTILCDVGHFEDFQFTFEYFLEDGVVVRFNKYGITTKYFELKGGICGSLGGMEERQKEMEENGKYMIERYGDMVKIKMKKWGTDLRMNYRYEIDSD